MSPKPAPAADPLKVNLLVQLLQERPRTYDELIAHTELGLQRRMLQTYLKRHLPEAGHLVKPHPNGRGPLRFSLALRGGDRGITYAYGVPEKPRGALMYFVVWSEGAFSADYRPRATAAAARAFRARVMGGYDDLRRVRAFETPGGESLCELWSARAR